MKEVYLSSADVFSMLEVTLLLMHTRKHPPTQFKFLEKIKVKTIISVIFTVCFSCCFFLFLFKYPYLTNSGYKTI